MTKKKTHHYIDNKKFYEVLKEYIFEKRRADSNGEEPPKIPEYVGFCLLEIAKNFANKYRFSNYSYKDEMISDAVLNNVLYLDRFDPDRTTNPFSYFTQATYFMFKQRDDKEKKQQYIKYKSMERAEVFHELSVRKEAGDVSDYGESFFYSDYSRDVVTDFIRDYEERKNIKKKK